MGAVSKTTVSNSILSTVCKRRPIHKASSIPGIVFFNCSNISFVLSTSKENSNKGAVVAIGEDVKSIKIGDTVLFNLGAGVSYSTSSDDYKILSEKDVLGKILGE